MTAELHRSPRRRTEPAAAAQNWLDFGAINGAALAKSGAGGSVEGGFYVARHAGQRLVVNPRTGSWTCGKRSSDEFIFLLDRRLGLAGGAAVPTVERRRITFSARR